MDGSLTDPTFGVTCACAAVDADEAAPQMFFEQVEWVRVQEEGGGEGEAACEEA